MMAAAATWTNEVSDASGVSRADPKRAKRRTPRWAMNTATGVLGLILGLMFGGGDASHDELVETQAQLTSTSTELESQSALLVTAQDALTTNEERVAELELAETENAAAVVATTELAAAQVTRTGELDTCEAELVARETAVTDRETVVTGREESVTVREAAAPAPATQNYSAPVPFAGVPAAPAPPSTTSYSNCAAVRVAGADLIRRGEPGYGGHLDRDGDGVGCE